jgi:uncharacterized protein
MDFASSVVLLLAAFLAGAINSIAGGGTLLSFPALVWLGRDPILANATNSVALWPGSLAGVVGFRREVASARRWLLFLTIPSLLGGTAGAILLLNTSSTTFSNIVPFLILGATLLLAAQEMITNKLQVVAHGHRWIAAAMLFQFLVGIYGGYFGAGMGILMLAALGLIGLTDLHQMNGLKNLMAICINGVAAIYFAFSGAVLWRDAGMMAGASIVGGFLGAKVARRLGRNFVRGLVVAIGLTMTVALWLRV